MNYLRYLVLSALILASCESKQKSGEAEKNNIKIVPIENDIKSMIYSDTIRIDYIKNKEILQILQLLPKESMGSWEWSLEERKDIVRSIAKKKYYIDTNPDSINLKYIQSNTMGIQVVDGFWTLSIYEIKENNYIVITDDIVGDGNDMVCYEFKDNLLSILPVEDVFGKLFKNTLINQEDSACLEVLDENLITFDYDFKDKQKVVFESWMLKEAENADCFLGNTLYYTFNATTKSFDLESVQWTNKKE